MPLNPPPLTQDFTMDRWLHLLWRLVTLEQSIVRLNTDAGFGSTNTAIRRFSTVVTNVGESITYADSAASGASFTINVDGLYAISFSHGTGTAGHAFGPSLNSAQLTTSFTSITASTKLAIATMAGVGFAETAQTTLYLSAGDVVRPHSVASASASGFSQFTIVRIR